MKTDRELLEDALDILNKGQWIHPRSTLHDEIRARLAEPDEQQVERERCREIVNSELDVNGRDDDWYIVCNAILEKIDE